MRKGFRLAVAFLVAALLCAGAGTAWAFPPLPASYYGEVQITGFVVAAGDPVLAFVPGVVDPVGHGTIMTYQTGLVYTIDVNGDDEDTPVKDGGVAGDPITFKIGDHVVMEATWAEGNHYRPIHPPTAVVQTGSSVNEGSPLTLDGSASTDAGNDIATYAFDCNGDGVFEIGPGTATTAICTFSNGLSSHTLGVRVVDGQGGVSTKTASVTVNNVLPTVTLPAAATINEGATFTGNGSFSDPGADTWTATVDYGEGAGSLGLTGKAFTLSHQYADSGVYQITVAVADGEGSGSQAMQVTVNNVAPTATFAASSPVSQGGSSTLSFSGATDVSAADVAAGLHYSFACDGLAASLAATYNDAALDTIKTCTFPDAGSYTVKGRIFDKDGGYTDYTQTVVVGNSAPVVSITSATTSLDEGGSFAGSGSFTDLGTDTWTATVEYGDSSGVASLTLAADKTFSLAHDYADNGSYTVKVTVTDAHQGAGNATQVVIVNNVAPTATFNAPAGEDEGSAIVLSLASPQDPGSADIAEGFEYAFDCGAGAGYGLWGAEPTASCPTSGVGSLTVKGQIRDKDGGVTAYTRPAEVRDVVPAGVAATAPSEATAGDPVTLSGSATNCLAVDHCTLTWKEGDTVLGIGASISYRWNHTGSHVVTLEVSDDDSNAATGSTTVTVAGLERSITLQPGWNLISFNVIPDDLSVAKVFESIAGQWDLAYAWDGASQGWRRADTAPGSGDTLTDLDEKQGFWVHITAATPVTFRIAGSLPEGDTQISLSGTNQGWNLVSLPAGAAQALSPTAIPNLSMVYQYRADEAMPWRLYDVNAPAWANDLTAMSPLYGYWVKVTAGGTWDVPYGNP